MTNLLFNPTQASTEELEATFIGRHALVEGLEENLIADQESRTPRHWQVIAPRGSGKSHLTELLARRMRTRHGWRIARLPEENYKVTNLGELLEQIGIRSESIPERSPFGGDMDDIQLQDRVLDILHQFRLRSQQPLLVVVENLASLFDRQLKTTHCQARLRDILTNNPPFILVSTSTSQAEAIANHSAPLYEFFQTIFLDDLSQSETTDLVRARAHWENNSSLLANFEQVKGRVEAIYHLSGGNPRLALALYRVVQQGVTTELHEQILKLLDEVTPYYQARLNDIPPQAARVLTEMAVAETAITPSEIARRCRIPTNHVTAQISKLLNERLVIQGGRPDARSRFYEFKDRLLRIWIQMRESTGSMKRLRFLAEFFERWYAGRADELEEDTRRAVSDLWTYLATGDDRQCVDRLKTISYLADITPGFDHSSVLRAMSSHVGESSPADVRTHVTALLRRLENTADLREREALVFLLAECYVALNAEEEGRGYLGALIDEGSRSEAIAARYGSALLAAKEFDVALTFGRDWMRNYPKHLSVIEPLSIAACSTGRYDESFDLLGIWTGLNLCGHCREKVLRRMINALLLQHADETLKLKFWNRFVSSEYSADATPAQIGAALEVLAEPRLSKIRASTFVEALRAWKPLDKAPPWLLGKSVCGLAHRPSYALPTLDVISAIAVRIPGPLGQAVVDHLVEVVARLRRLRHEKEDAEKAYLTAISLIRRRTTPDSLAIAFRLNAPGIVKDSPVAIKELIQLYEEWLEEGLLVEPITPYSETVAVLNAAEPPKALQALHPETRDAVSLLLTGLSKATAVHKEGQGQQDLVAPRHR
jgi:hypothetical protein